MRYKHRGVYLDCYKTGMVTVPDEQDLEIFLVDQLGQLRVERLGVGLLAEDNEVLAWTDGRYFTNNTHTTVSWNRLDIVRLIAMERPSKLFMAHNHPGGTLEFSDADNEATESIRLLCEHLGLVFMGHYLVVGDVVLKTGIN